VARHSDGSTGATSFAFVAIERHLGDPTHPTQLSGSRPSDRTAVPQRLPLVTNAGLPSTALTRPSVCAEDQKQLGAGSGSGPSDRTAVTQPLPFLTNAGLPPTILTGSPA